MHDADGETMLYRSLAHALDPQHTVYGLQPYSNKNHPILHTRFEEMAEVHIGTIRTIQSRGPYLLGGLCAGGLIAFEIARQLQRAGETVAMVALLDAADVAARQAPLRIAKSRLNSFASTFEQGTATSGRRRAGQVIRMAARKAGNLTRYVFQSRTEAVRNGVRMRLFRACRDLGLPAPRFLQDIPVRTAYLYARSSYRPKSPVDGELLLLRATSGTGIDEPFRNRYTEPLMGWDRRATGKVRAFDVPGGHSSMLQEPHVRVVAQHLQSYINEALKRPTHGARPLDTAFAAKLGSASANDTMTPAQGGESRPFHLVLVSARSRSGMESAAGRLGNHLSGLHDQQIADVCYSLATGPPALEWRRVVVGVTRDELIERLHKGTGRGVWSGLEPTIERPVAFVLAGVGEQAGGVGRGLYASEPAFRAAADHCADVLKPLLGQDIRQAMFTAPKEAGNWLRGGGDNVLKDTRVAQPAAFVLDWALAQMWMSWGIKPAALLGYSVGEYVAAALSGVLRLDDALEIVARRAAWIQDKAQPGVMLAVPLAEAELGPLLGEDLWFAAINSPQATVVGGREASIERLEEKLKGMEVVTRRVASEQGSHTPLLDPVRSDLSQLVARIGRDEPRIPLWSNVTGQWLTAVDAQDVDYWGAHMCGPVRFEQGVGELLRNQELIILEVGPGAGLGAMVRQNADFGRERMGACCQVCRAPGIGQRIESTWPGYWGGCGCREPKSTGRHTTRETPDKWSTCPCLHSKASRRGPSRNRPRCKKLAPCLAPTRGE